MMKPVLFAATAVLVAGSIAPSAATAAKPRTVRPAAIAALDACRSISDGAARLACYDKAVPALTEGVTRGDVAVVDREEMRQTRRSLFGFSLPNIPFLGGGSKAKGEPEQKSLTSSVVSASRGSSGHYMITIADNDAVWETTEGSDTIDTPRRGDKVAIEKGALGSYFLQVGSQRWVRARRVR